MCSNLSLLLFQTQVFPNMFRGSVLLEILVVLFHYHGKDAGASLFWLENKIGHILDYHVHRFPFCYLNGIVPFTNSFMKNAMSFKLGHLLKDGKC